MVDRSATLEAERLFYFSKNMKNTQYINIQGWMINELKLKSNDLLVYAIIYGFSQDGESKFNGSLSYLKEATNSSRATIIRTLKTLECKGLIMKVNSKNKHMQTNTYVAEIDVVSKLNGGSVKMIPPTGIKMQPNNTITNNTNNNIDWNQLIIIFNKITGKRIKSVNDKAKRQIKNILKDYDKKDFLLSIKNCYEDDYHLETKHKYLTLEFISRPDKFERFYGMQPKVTKNDLGNRANDLLNREENS